MIIVESIIKQVVQRKRLKLSITELKLLITFIKNRCDRLHLILDNDGWQVSARKGTQEIVSTMYSNENHDHSGLIIALAEIANNLKSD